MTPRSQFDNPTINAYALLQHEVQQERKVMGRNPDALTHCLMPLMPATLNQADLNSSTTAPSPSPPSHVERSGVSICSCSGERRGDRERRGARRQEPEGGKWDRVMLGCFLPCLEI